MKQFGISNPPSINQVLEIFERLPNKPMVTLPPWPGVAKVQRKKTCFVQVYFALSKSQSFNRVLDMLML